MPGRIYNALFQLAADQYGYVTSDDARELGIDPQRLVVMQSRELLERIDRGLYRVVAIPPSPLDQYMEASLWPHRVRGVLSHETALDLHELCDVSPAKIHLTLPARYRNTRAVPDLYVIHRRDLEEREKTLHEGIPIVTPVRAILDGIERNLGSRLVEQAIETARRRGLVRADETRLIEERRSSGRTMEAAS